MRSPSTRTVHAPHSPRSQPFFVPVSARRSRSASSSVTLGSTATAYLRPLTDSVISMASATSPAVVGATAGTDEAADAGTGTSVAPAAATAVDFNTVRRVWVVAG